MTTPLATSGRVRFSQGRAELVPVTRTPAGMVRAEASVVSPGTERRHLAQTTHGPGRDAGYLNLARTPNGQWVLAPCPHGSAFAPRVPGAVTADGTLPAYLIALARFQLMAARGLDRVPILDLEEVLVVGSGPVATGCVLELRRRGANRIRVCTRRADIPLLSQLPGLVCTTRPGPGQAGLVVDTTGDPRWALKAARSRAVVGLLGTPGPGTALDALTVHQAGTSVVGMHELAGAVPGGPTYQHVFDRVTEWLAQWPERAMLESWCRHLPGEQAPGFYADLLQGRRLAEPVVLWEWT